MPNFKSCKGMDGPNGPRCEMKDLATTVLTCEGNLSDPSFPNRLRHIVCKLKHLLSEDKKPFHVTKVEPWNSVRVTFNIPRNAAQRLRQLAERGDTALRELGILSVQIEGDQVITLTLSNNHNFNENHHQELFIGKTNETRSTSSNSASSSASTDSPTSNVAEVSSSLINVSNSPLLSTSNHAISSISSSISSSDYIGSPSNGPASLDHGNRKNIANYLSQQAGVNVNVSAGIVTNNLFHSSSSSSIAESVTFRSPNVVAPANNEPIPYNISSSSANSNSQSVLSSVNVTSTPTSHGSPSITLSSSSPSLNVSTTTCSSSNLSARLNQISNSVANPSARCSQSSAGLFPFASMQHAINTKQGINSNSNSNSNCQLNSPTIQSPIQQANQVNASSSSLRFQFNTNVSQMLPNSSSFVSFSPSLVNNSNNSGRKSITPPISSSQHSYLPATTSSVINHVKISHQPQSATRCSIASTASASANVALSSPLLVNLLQSDSSSGHSSHHAHNIKVNTHNNTSQINANPITNETQKAKKPRKPRKSKDKPRVDGLHADAPVMTSSHVPPLQHTPFTSNITQSCNSLPISSQTTTTTTQYSMPSSPFQPHSLIDSSLTPSITPASLQQQHMIGIPITATQRLSAIRPEDVQPQGQPQVVHSSSSNSSLECQSQSQEKRHENEQQEDVSLRSVSSICQPINQHVFISTSATPVTRDVETASSLHAIINTKTQTSKQQQDNSSLDANQAITSSSASTTSFSSTDKPRDQLEEAHTTTSYSPNYNSNIQMTGKTKHLINPFTGHLEPMLSDEEEERTQENQMVFTDMMMETNSDNNGGQSERSLSDSGSNGKDNNHSSSDTDSGIGKSNNDGSSQSSVEVGDGNGHHEHGNAIVHNHIDATSSQHQMNSEKLRLRLKVEPKTSPDEQSEEKINTSLCMTETTPTSLTSNSVSPVSLKSQAIRYKAMNMNIPSSTSQQTTIISHASIEPRVPPLHISIRGPNSAVVISNRRESTSELEIKPSKKPRGVRTSRAMSAESTLEASSCPNVNRNQRKKMDREQRFLSGGGIIVTNLSINASSTKSVESQMSESVIDDVKETLSMIKSEPQLVDNNDRPSESYNSGAESVSNINPSAQVIQSDDKNISLTMNVPRKEHIVDVIDGPISGHDNENTRNENDFLNRECSTKEIEESVSIMETSSSPLRSKVKSDVTISDQNHLTMQIQQEEDACQPASHPIVSSSLTISSDSFILNASTLPSSSHGKSSEINLVDAIHTHTHISSTQHDVPETNESEVMQTPLKHQQNMSCENEMEYNIANFDESEQELKKDSHNSNSNDISSKSNDDLSLETNPSQILTQSNVCVSQLNATGSLYQIDIVDEEKEQTNEDDNKKQLMAEEIVTTLGVKSGETDIEDKNENKEILIENKSEVVSSACETHVDKIMRDETVIVKEIGTCNTTSDIPFLNTQIEENKTTEGNRVENEDLSSSNRSENAEEFDKVRELTQDKECNEEAKSTTRCDLTSSLSSDDKSKQQPLEIVISTSVPSILTPTTTTTSMFPQVKSSAIENSGRVTFITFKPNLNSPNQTNSQTLTLTSDKANTSVANSLHQKAVPVKLLTIPSASGGITVRSATNKLVELINSSSSASPLSPHSNSHSPNACNSTLNASHSPVRLLVSKVSPAGTCTTNATPGSVVTTNSLGQLVMVNQFNHMVKSVVVSKPSQSSSFKLVTARNPSLNASSLQIPFRSKIPETLDNKIAAETNEQNPQLLAFASPIAMCNTINTAMTNVNYNLNVESVNHHDDVVNDSQEEQDELKDEVQLSQTEPVDLTLSCQEESIMCVDDTKLASVNVTSNESTSGVTLVVESGNEALTDDDELTDEDKLNSVAFGDHNYILKKTESSENHEDEDSSVLNLSNSTVKIMASRNEPAEEDYSLQIQALDFVQTNKPSHQDSIGNSLPDKQKYSENSTEMIKAYLGSSMPSGMFSLVTNQAIDSTSNSQNCSSKVNHSFELEASNVAVAHETVIAFRPKSSRTKRNRLMNNDSNDIDCESSSQDEDELNCNDQDQGKNEVNKQRLRTTKRDNNNMMNMSVYSNHEASSLKQMQANRKQTNCKDDAKKDAILNTRRKGLDQSKRSTRRSRERDQPSPIVLNADLNMNNEHFSGPSLTQDLEMTLPNDSLNDFNCSSVTSASTITSAIINKPNLILKRKKARNVLSLTSAEKSESLIPTKRRRIAKESHR